MFVFLSPLLEIMLNCSSDVAYAKIASKSRLGYHFILREFTEIGTFWEKPFLSFSGRAL